MDLLTFGQVILFENNHYVWLVSDEEEGKIHLAKILDVTLTRDLINLDERTAKKNKGFLDSPMFAYVVLTTNDFDGRAACLANSGEYAGPSDGFDRLGTLIDSDIKELKKKCLEGRGLSARLIKLVKGLG